MSEAWLARAAVFHPVASGVETVVSGGGVKAGAVGAIADAVATGAVPRIRGMTTDALA